MATVHKRKWTTPAGETREAWQVRYRDPRTGKHPGKAFKLRKDADAFRKKVEREIEDGTHILRASSKTISQTIAEFLADLQCRTDENQVGVGYFEQTRRALSFAIEPLGGVMLSELTWQLVHDYGRTLRTTKGGRTKRKLANGTIRICLDTLSRAVAYGVRRGYAVRNVVPDAIKELGTIPVRPIETFTVEEMKQMLRAIEDRTPKQTRRGQAFLRAATYLGAMCGLRRGEILALTWDAVDFERLLVHVRHNLTPQDVLKSPKTLSGYRTVPLPTMVVDALRRWEPFVVPESRGLIFRSRTGGAWQDATFYRDTWHPLLRKAGIVSDREYGHRHFHALRHFAGSSWLSGGVPLPDVSRLLGHANVAITARVYSHAITVVHEHRAGAISSAASLIAPAARSQITHMAA